MRQTATTIRIEPDSGGAVEVTRADDGIIIVLASLDVSAADPRIELDSDAADALVDAINTARGRRTRRGGRETGASE